MLFDLSSIAVYLAVWRPQVLMADQQPLCSLLAVHSVASHVDLEAAQWFDCT